MALCGICPDPGHCCQGFTLSRYSGDRLTFWAESWQEDAIAEMERRGLPFWPDHVYEIFISPGFREYVTLSYTCDHLTDEGRCGIYATRPDVCRTFVPGTSPLCVFGEGCRETVTRTLAGKDAQP